MEKTHTTPKDFFLFAGAIISLYGSIAAFLVLVFEYINRFLPDPAMMYSYDVFGGGTRFAMASLIVLGPVTAVLFALIRRGIKAEPAKANTWVRRFAIVLTLFLASGMLIVDLITLITTFLGGELTLRFGLKVVVVLLIGKLVFMHFIADSKGYWIAFPKRARVIGVAVAVLALATVVAGFFIIGTPAEARRARFDNIRAQDLENIQWQIVNFYQQKQTLPADLAELTDPLSSFKTPTDPETESAYEYERTSDSSFLLCATFTTAASGNQSMAHDVMMPETDFWAHEVGRTCFPRTIDPERYPAFAKPVVQ